MKTKTICHTVNFKAAPREVYEMIMDSKSTSRYPGRRLRSAGR